MSFPEVRRWVMGVEPRRFPAAVRANCAPRGRLLLVDEDMRDLLYYTSALKQNGFEVRSFASYGEALVCLEEEAFDLVIVSQGGPGFEGSAVLRSAKERDRNLPVLVLTRSLDMGCYLEAMQWGAFDYVEKPLAASEVARIVGTHLRAPFVLA